jgi:ABC-type transport system involved in multi-copper enzyme maturation permease subunit
MRSLWGLVGFEYIKVLKRNGVIFTLLLLLILTVISPAMTLVGMTYANGEPWESRYDAMVKDRAHARSLAGRELDTELLVEMKDAYSRLPMDAGPYTLTPEYEAYARRYSEVFGILRGIYQGADTQTIFLLTDEDLAGIYDYRNAVLAKRVSKMNISENAKAWILEQDAKVTTPWVFDYTDGQYRFLVLAISTGLFTTLALAVCLAPLFAGEYAAGVNALILSSKYGKTKVITAKLLTAVTFSAAVAALMVAITWIVSMLLFGFDGANAWVQMAYSPYVTFPITMAKMSALMAVCIILASILVAAITALLSSKFPTPFGVIVIVGVLLIYPMFTNAPENNMVLLGLYRLLPTQMMNLATHLYYYIPYEFFGVCIPPYVIPLLFAMVASAVMLPLAGRWFGRHQVG